MSNLLTKKYFFPSILNTIGINLEIKEYKFEKTEFYPDISVSAVMG